MGIMNDMNDNLYFGVCKCECWTCIADGRVHVGWHDDRSAVMITIISVDGVAFCDVIKREGNNPLVCSGRGIPLALGRYA